MADTRKKNVNWTVATPNGDVPSWERASIAVLMDIRDEMQSLNMEMRRLNALLHCPNFIEIPRILRRVRSNTANMPKAAQKAKP